MAESDGQDWFAPRYFAQGYWNVNYWPAANPYLAGPAKSEYPVAIRQMAMGI